MNGEFLDALRQIEREKEIPIEVLIETVEVAISTAYRRAFQEDAEIRLRPDARGRGLRLVCEKVVSEEIENPHVQISLSDAQRINPRVQIGDKVEAPLPEAGFGRIAAQTAKQVVVQRLREAERAKIFEQFGHRVGEVVTGTVQRREHRNVILVLGRTEALLPASEQVRGEPYRFNDRIKLYLLEVRQATRGPQIVVSRSHPALIRRLFELEVPEIEDGTVLIEEVAREPGARSKIAVSSTEVRVDPVGACVGHRGSRVQAVVGELYGEKIDIIRYHEDAAEFLREALSPAKPISVALDEEQKSAYVVVPDTQLSLAIGKEGQNVRLAARLTGWRIDIRSEAQAEQRKMDELRAQVEAEIAAGDAALEAERVAGEGEATAPEAVVEGAAEAAASASEGEPAEVETTAAAEVAEAPPAEGVADAEAVPEDETAEVEASAAAEAPEATPAESIVDAEAVPEDETAEVEASAAAEAPEATPTESIVEAEAGAEDETLDVEAATTTEATASAEVETESPGEDDVEAAENEDNEAAAVAEGETSESVD